MAKKKRMYIDEYMNYPAMMTEEEIVEREKEIEELKKKKKMKIKKHGYDNVEEIIFEDLKKVF
jgi:hypothetical protein